MRYEEIKTGSIVETAYGFAKVVGTDEWASYYICLAPKCLFKAASATHDYHIERWSEPNLEAFRYRARGRYVIIPDLDDCHYFQFHLLHIHLDRVIKIVTDCPVNFE